MGKRPKKICIKTLKICIGEILKKYALTLEPEITFRGGKIYTSIQFVILGDNKEEGE